MRQFAVSNLLCYSPSPHRTKTQRGLETEMIRFFRLLRHVSPVRSWAMTLERIGYPSQSLQKTDGDMGALTVPLGQIATTTLCTPCTPLQCGQASPTGQCDNSSHFQLQQGRFGAIVRLVIGERPIHKLSHQTLRACIIRARNRLQGD